MNKLDYGGWRIRSTCSMRENKKYYESVFSQGNGYMGIRGTLPEDMENQSYERCTYIAGVFDYIKDEITDMVNTPDFMDSKIVIGKEVFNPLDESVEKMEQSLCFKDGTLERSYWWNTKNYGAIVIKSKRFLSIEDVHTAAIRYEIKALEKSCDVLFQTGINANITNQCIEDDQLKQNNNVLKMTIPMEYLLDEAVSLKVITSGKAKIQIMESVMVDTEERDLVATNVKEDGYVGKKI